MKKLIALAAVAILLVAGSASAQWGRHAVAKPNATFAFGAAGIAPGPSTTNNDDSCDISTAPAATLLLPYFEVETASRATTTFFTITNTSELPQIAHVTLWTDWSFPVLDFNIYLTGYDVQSIDLYDIIVNGTIAPGSGTGGTGISNTNSTNGKTNGGSGSTYNSFNMTGNPNWVAAAVANCDNLPGAIRPDILAAVKSALVTGSGYTFTGGACTSSTNVGSPATSHTTTTTAVGYATIDVAADCNQLFPSDYGYYNTAAGILFDNVLTGDYQILNKATGSNYAGGNPLVHIRAIPEGGPSPATVNTPTGTTNLPYTFYSRYSSTAALPNVDRRQPLPSVFAARWIQGGPLALNTNFRVWREGVTGASAPPATAPFTVATVCTNASQNSALPITELVRFDEHENFLTLVASGCQTSPCPTAPVVSLPESSSTSTTAAIYPPANFASGDVGGWMYMNLAQPSGTFVTEAANAGAIGPQNTGLGMLRASQNWVIVALSGSGSTAGQYGVDFDATWLGNGCSGRVPLSTLQAGGTFPIGPVGYTGTGGPLSGVLVCPAGDPGCTETATTYTNLTVTPNTTGPAGSNQTP